MDRHEALRTVFIEENGEPHQQVQVKGLWKLEEEVARSASDNLSIYIGEKVKKPFDLSSDFMLRATLVPVEKNEHLLIITMHHIASDGWSMPVIVKEFVSLYISYSEKKPIELKPLSIQYADYAIWQKNYLKGEILEKKLS